MALLVNNAKGLFGGLVGSDVVVKDFTAKGTLVAGRTVKYDVSQTGESRASCVVEGDATSAVVGIALEAAVSGDRVRCLVSGYITGVLTDGTVTADEPITGGAAGSIALWNASSAYAPCGTSLEVDASTTSGGIVFRAVA